VDISVAVRCCPGAIDPVADLPRYVGDGPLAAGHGPNDQKRLGPRRDRVGQRGIWRFVGQILLTREEPYEGPALVRDLVTHRAAQHRIAGLEGVEDRTLRGLTLDVEFHLTVDAR
jgi:hypothetical protein